MENKKSEKYFENKYMSSIFPLLCDFFTLLDLLFQQVFLKIVHL